MMMMLMKYSSVLKLNTKRIGGWIFFNAFLHTFSPQCLFHSLEHSVDENEGVSIQRFFFVVVAEIRFLICPVLTMGERIDVLESGGRGGDL